MSELNKLQHLARAKKEASNIENLPWWRSKIKDLINLGCDYQNGEPRRYYKEEKRDVYWYRVVAEAELHRAR